MAQAPQSFTDMFKNLGEQLKLPQVDVAKIMEHHQKNLDAMARSWQAVASGAGLRGIGGIQDEDAGTGGGDGGFAGRDFGARGADRNRGGTGGDR